MNSRTFIALPLRPGPETLNDLTGLKQMLKGERISWVHPENFHITLRFVGDTSAPEIDSITRALQARMLLPGRRNLIFTGPELFGPRRSPRVIVLGLKEQWILRDLHRQVEQILQSCGILPAENVFRAHLTLGRIRAVQDPARFQEALEVMRERFRQGVPVERLVFYRSELGEGSPVYTPLWSGKFPD